MEDVSSVPVSSELPTALSVKERVALVAKLRQEIYQSEESVMREIQRVNDELAKYAVIRHKKTVADSASIKTEEEGQDQLEIVVAAHQQNIDKSQAKIKHVIASGDAQTCIEQLKTEFPEFNAYSQDLYDAMQHYLKSEYPQAKTSAELAARNEAERELASTIFANAKKRSDPNYEMNVAETTMFHEVVSRKFSFYNIAQAIAYFNKEKYDEALVAAKSSIEKNSEVSLSHLIIALSLYKQNKSMIDVLDHLNKAQLPATHSKAEKFSKAWAGCLLQNFNIPLEQVVDHVAHQEEPKVDEFIDKYTTYQILKRLHAKDKISRTEYVERLKNLGVVKVKSEDKENAESANSLYKKIERQIDMYSKRSKFMRMTVYGAAMTRKMFRKSREVLRDGLNSANKRSDDVLKTIGKELDFTLTGLALVGLKHLIIHIIPFVVKAMWAGVRMIGSPIVGVVYSSKKAKKAVSDEVRATLPIKYKHVTRCTDSLPLFTKQILAQQLKPKVNLQKTRVHSLSR